MIKVYLKEFKGEKDKLFQYKATDVTINDKYVVIERNKSMVAVFDVSIVEIVEMDRRCEEDEAEIIDGTI